MINRCPMCGSFYVSDKFCTRDGATLEPSEGVVDRYQIVDRVGEGGMGVVYKAQHTLLDNRVVAIKLLHRQLSQNPEVVNRFFREAKAASRVENEHIVKVVDFGVTAAGDSFLVMEYLEGISLSDLLEEKGALSVLRAMSIGVQIAEGLYAAHRKGIVHRDLKPENVLLLRQGEQEFVKLLDFGIAKLTETPDTRLTQLGMVVGTPSYMSPEQAGGEPVDLRTDIYALGTILYEMLTGRCPFQGETVKQVLLCQMTQDPTPPRELRPEIPEPIEEVILHALNKDREERPQTMIHLAYALRDALLKRGVTYAGSGAWPAAGEELHSFTDGLHEVSHRLGQKLLVPLRRFLPLIGLGAGVILGVVLTVWLMGPDDSPQRALPAASSQPAKAAPDEQVTAFNPIWVSHKDAGTKTKRKARRISKSRARRSSPWRRRSSKRSPPQEEVTPTASRFLATVISTPPRAEVYDGDQRLGQTPMKVPTDRARKLTLHRLGFDSVTLSIPRESTKTHSARLKKSAMSWEVLSLSQLKKMMQDGQISRFTYNRRREDLIKIRDKKIMDLKIKLKLGHITQQQYERAVQGVKDSYK